MTIKNRQAFLLLAGLRNKKPPGFFIPGGF